VAGAVLDVADQVLALAEPAQDLLDDEDVLALGVAAEVVDLARLAVLHRHADALAVVGHVDPVAHVLAVAVDRQLLALERVGDHQRDQLLGKLVRPVVVRAARDDAVHVVRVHRGAHQEVAAGLAGRVRRVGLDRRLFGEEAPGAERAVDLVGADVHEALDLVDAALVEQHLGAGDVGAHEGGGVDDAAVDVALGGEVHDHVGAVLGEHRVHRGRFGDVRPHERVALVLLDVGQVLEVAGVGQCVDVDDLVVAAEQQHAHEVRADEAGTAGDEDLAHSRCSLWV